MFLRKHVVLFGVFKCMGKHNEISKQDTVCVHVEKREIESDCGALGRRWRLKVSIFAYIVYVQAGTLFVVSKVRL